MVKGLEVDGDDVGVHIWRVAGRGRSQHLQLVTAFFWERKIAPSITWRKEKGVLGACWTDEAEQVRDVTSEHVSKDQWEKLPDAEKHCLTWSEVHRTRHFHAIWAMPLFSPTGCGNRFRGCISVDVATPGTAEKLKAITDNKSAELEALIASCQIALSGDVAAEPL
jgi:hypothetical protein